MSGWSDAEADQISLYSHSATGPTVSQSNWQSKHPLPFFLWSNNNPKQAEGMLLDLNYLFLIIIIFFLIMTRKCVLKLNTNYYYTTCRTNKEVKSFIDFFKIFLKVTKKKKEDKNIFQIITLNNCSSHFEYCFSVSTINFNFVTKFRICKRHQILFSKSKWSS